MDNEKFKSLAKEIFDVTEDEEFFICSLDNCNVVILDLNGNMYREFMYYYVNQNILKTLWELRVLGLAAITRSAKEYLAINKLMMRLM